MEKTILFCALCASLSLGAFPAYAEDTAPDKNASAQALSDVADPNTAPYAGPVNAPVINAPDALAIPAKISVTIFPFVNKTGDSSYEAASGTALDILSFTLKSLSECEVTALQADPVERTDDAIGVWAETSGVDVVLYGEILLDANSDLKVRLSAYNRGKGKTIVSDETAYVPLLDIFSVCDGLSLSVISEMTGRHIGFARVNFKNSGEQGTYEILIDGNMVGKDLSSIAGWREGAHEIVVRQTRMLSGYELYRQNVTLVEGVPCTIPFAIPRLIPDEKKKIADLETEIQSLWNTQSSDAKVDADIAAYMGLFAHIEYCPSLAPYRDKAAKFVSSRESYHQGQQVRILSDRVTALESEIAKLSAQNELNGAESKRVSENLSALSDEIRSKFPQTENAQSKVKKPDTKISETTTTYPDAVPNTPPTKNYKKAGITMLVIGVLGTALLGFAYMNGSSAYSDYEDAATADDASSARKKVSSWNTLAMVGAGVGSIGLISAPICFGADVKQHKAR